MMQSKIENRYYWIDTLKGIAALLVIVLHFWEKVKNMYFMDGGHLLHHFFDFITIGFIDTGKVGVAIFFIISGYLIADAFKKKSIKEFVVKKAKRLYPVYWLSLILSIILISRVDIKTFVINATMFQGFVRVSDVVGVYWTLQIILYFLCVFLQKINKFNDTKVIDMTYYVFICLTLIFGIGRFAMNKNLPVAIGLLISLSLLGIMIKRNETGTKYNMKANVIIFVITLFFTSIFAYSNHFTNIFISARYICSYLIALFLFFAIKKNVKKSNLFSKLGVISYSIYLLHPTIGFWILKSLYLCGVNVYINVLCSLLGTIFVSYISHKYIEEKVK